MPAAFLRLMYTCLLSSLTAVFVPLPVPAYIALGQNKLQKLIHHTNSVCLAQMIDFGLADFREVFGAGYVTGKKRSLIHNEPHHVQPLRHQNSKGGTSDGQPGEAHDNPSDPAEQQHHQRVPIRGNKGIAKRSDAVPKGMRVSKFFPTPAGLIPQVSLLQATPPLLAAAALQQQPHSSA